MKLLSRFPTFKDLFWFLGFFCCYCFSVATDVVFFGGNDFVVAAVAALVVNFDCRF